MKMHNNGDQSDRININSCQDIEKRLAKLEKKHKRLILFIIGFICFYLLIRFIHLSLPRSIEANHLKISDPYSQAGIELFTSAGSCLKINDREGQTRASLFVNQGNPVLNLNDSMGKTRLSLSVADDKPAMFFYGMGGEAQAGVTIQNNAQTDYEDTPVFTIYDNQGALQTSVIIQDSSPEVILQDPNGDMIYSAALP